MDWKSYFDKCPLLVGVDEVGRGCLAGPVVSAAVCYRDGDFVPNCRDSKRLTDKKRREVASYITQTLPFAIGVATVEEIDELNILQASLLSMKRAVENLALQVNSEMQMDSFTSALILVDGNQLIPGLAPKWSQLSCVGGDANIEPIGAASVVAKVFRDDLMVNLDQMHPQYDFLKNKGYGTKAHMESMVRYGLSPFHRRSFRPCGELA